MPGASRSPFACIRRPLNIAKSRMTEVADQIWQLFERQSPLAQALIAGLLTWLITGVGAAVVFCTSRVNQKLLDSMFGFAAGVMMAASYWSLLAPALEISEAQGHVAWLAVTIGLILGVATIWGIDKTLPHLHPDMSLSDAEGPNTAWHRSILLVTAITLHNIPEGLAVGVAFGGVSAEIGSIELASAVALALGIGLQNAPEGIAVAMPLRAEGASRMKSFWYGQLSALVEPIAAVLGAATVLSASVLLPYALSFAAGAMIYVVVEELIPASHRAGNVDLATVSFAGGFTVMMVLDVSLR
jgi:ZIP family zinc transporter